MTSPRPRSRGFWTPPVPGGSSPVSFLDLVNSSNGGGVCGGQGSVVLCARRPRSGSAPRARRGPPPYPAPLPPESPDSFGFVTYDKTRTRLGSGSRRLTAREIRFHLRGSPLPPLPRPGSCSGSRAVGNLWSLLPVSGVSCSVLEVSGVSCSFPGGISQGLAGVVGSVLKKPGKDSPEVSLVEFLDFLDTVERGSGVSCRCGRVVSRHMRHGKPEDGRTLRRVLVHTSLELLYG